MAGFPPLYLVEVGLRSLDVINDLRPPGSLCLFSQIRGKGKKRRIGIDYRARRFAREKVDIAYMQEIGFWGYEQT